MSTSRNRGAERAKPPAFQARTQEEAQGGGATAIDAVLSSMLARTELGLGLVIALLIAFLHVMWVRHAGALWRDEVVSLYVSTKPSLSDLWSSLKFDSFPGLFHLILRAWVGLGLGATDGGLRVLGLCVGISVVAGLWLNARMLGFGVPLISMTLFALNALTIQAGDSLRSYGLGMLLALLTFVATWKVADSPTTARVVLAMAAAILSVNCLYQNAVILLGICVGGCIVALRRGLWRRGALVVAIGAVSAVSLTLHLGIIREMLELRVLLPTGLTLERIWSMFSKALRSGGGLMLWVWIGLFAFGLLAAAIAQASSVGSAAIEARRDLILYGGTVMVAGTIGFLVFLKMLDMHTEPWYYLLPMALAAICLDVVLGTLAAERLAWRVTRLAFAAIVGVCVFLPAWRGVQVRQTNVDLIAAEMERIAAKDDLILVYPWFCGATFDRYYRGTTFWTTLPPHADLKLQRLDLLRKQMASTTNPIEPVLDRIAKTLQSGNRIWLVGGLPVPEKGQRPPQLPPAPHGPWGWNISPYVESWATQAGYFIVSHALRGDLVPSSYEAQVNPYENLQVVVVQGWRSL